MSIRSTNFNLSFLIFLLPFIIGVGVQDIFASRFSETLETYGLLTLKDKAIAKDLSSRFNGEGTPLFMVSDVQVGLSQGDIIRWNNKVVLIDADVWATLKAINALRKDRKSVV